MSRFITPSVFRPKTANYSHRLHRTDPDRGFKPARPTQTGPFVYWNDGKTELRYGYFFFVTFAVCEDNEGDCVLWLDESPSYTTDENGNVKSRAKQGIRKMDRAHDSGRSPLMQNWGDCDTVLIFSDAPGAYIFEPNTVDKLFLSQELTVRDKANPFVELGSLSHFLTMEVHSDGIAMARP